MPANLTPDYYRAEKAFKQASDDSQRMLALEEMLRVIPKHKGTEHMRADLRKRLSKLKAALETGGKKSGSGHVDIFNVPKVGAGQIALIGTGNCGKSSILAALTRAHVNVTDYPFGTSAPVPGMMDYQDIKIQLVDTPPVTADYAAPGQVQTYRSCDIIAIVIDLFTDPIEQMDICTKYLAEHKLIIDSDKPDQLTTNLAKKTLVVCTKTDIAEQGAFDTFAELYSNRFDCLEISAETRDGLQAFAEYIFQALDIIRVYAKKPGKEADMKEPFVLPKGSDITDLAYVIHRELAEKLKTAHSWNAPGIHDGQNVHKTHQLTDKEIIELHFN